MRARRGGYYMTRILKLKIILLIKDQEIMENIIFSISINEKLKIINCF
jgi:hypothetical protein